MSTERNIEKATITELVAQQAPFTAVSNKTVELIRNPDALAIWTYLQTRAPGWKVIGSHLQDHFDMGRIRYRKAMKDLSEIGLLSHFPVRDAGGHMAGTRIVVHYQPKWANPDSSAPPSVQVTDHSVSATLAETTPYVSNELKANRNGEEQQVGASAKPASRKFDPLTARPANVSPEAWADWCQHRREIRKALTAKTCEQQAKALAGHSAPDAVLRQSIANGWTGIFPDKVGNSIAPTVPRRAVNGPDFHSDDTSWANDLGML